MTMVLLYFLLLLILQNANGGLPWGRRRGTILERSATTGRKLYADVEESVLIPALRETLLAYGMSLLCNRVPGMRAVCMAFQGLVKLNMRKPADRKFLEAAQLAVEKTKIDRLPDSLLNLRDSVELVKVSMAEINAFALGTFSVVGVSTGLLEKNIPREVMASIVAHEFAHIHRRHDIVTVFKMSVLQKLLVFVAKRFAKIPGLNLIEMGIRTLLWWNAEVRSKPIDGQISRDHEYEADSFAGDALGENNMVLGLQAVAGVPCSLISLQHALGVIFLRPWMFRDWDRVREATGGRERLLALTVYRDWSPPAEKPRWVRAKDWLLGGTHPDAEARMLRLLQQKKLHKQRSKTYLQ